MVTCRENTGDTPETAVVVEGAANGMEGVKAEYEYLAGKFGEKGTDWDLTMQSLVQHEGRMYDRMDVELADGTAHTVYFDISGFFGKF